MAKGKDLFNTTSVIVIITLITLVFYYFHLVGDSKPIPSNYGVTEIYYADGITSTHQEIIDRFNEKYKNRIKVIAIDLPFEKFSTNDRKELLARSLRGKGTKIDVFAVDIVWAYRFGKWSVNLAPYFSDEYLDKFVEPSLETCFYQDSLIASPFTLDLSTMYYRNDILEQFSDYQNLSEKLSRSIYWSDFIQLGKRFNSNNPFYIYPASDYEGLVCSFFELILNQNREFFDNESIDLTRLEALKALNLLNNLIQKYNLTPENVTGFTEFPSHKYFLDNEGVFIRSWPAFFLDIPDSSDINFRKIIRRAPMPHFKGTTPAAVFGGWNLMVSKFSEHIPEAIEFIKFLHTPEIQRILVLNDISLPVVKSIYDEENTEISEILTFYKMNLKYGVHRPLLEDYTRISDITSYFIRKVLMNELEPEYALREATRMIKSNEPIFK
jgi:multiple sugar transport system substrate-binding protein